jgi:hypothetical protein
MRSVEALAVRAGWQIREMEQPTAKQVGLQWIPAPQIGAGLNDHIRSGRAGQVETEASIG